MQLRSIANSIERIEKSSIKDEVRSNQPDENTLYHQVFYRTAIFQKAKLIY